ncbi:MAG: efflux RND transporter permease subunit [Planctomycetota bacterium]
MADNDNADHERRQLTFSARLFSKIIDYPAICLVTILAISAVAIGGYLDPDWPSRWKAWVQGVPAPVPEESGVSQSKEPQRFGQPRRGGRNSGGRSDAVLVIKSPSIFTPDGAVAFRQVVENIRQLDVVASARSLDEAPPLNIFGLAEPILPRGRATPQRFEASKEKAVNHPLVVGQMLSPDAKTALVEVQYDWVFVRKDEDCVTPLLEAAKQAAAQFPQVPMEFHVTGSVPFRLMISRNNRQNEYRYQFIAYAMILGMAALLFRGLSVVLVVAAAPVMGVLWTLGFLRYFGWQDNPFSFVILPILLSLVGFTDGVHMMIHIRKSMREGMEPRAACKHTLELVGLACFLTSLTTAIGMASLGWASHETVREFGWSCVIGVVATWISVMLVIPLACTTRWSRRFTRGAQQDFLDRNLDRVGPAVSAIMRRDRWFSYFAILLTLGLGWVASSLRPDDRKSSALPSGSDIQQSMAHLDNAMGGLEVCAVQVQWDPAKQTEEQIVPVLSEVETALKSEPLIGHPLSLARLLEALPGDGSAVDKLSMAELLPPPLKQAIFTPDKGQARVTFRCQDLGTATYKPTFERIEQALRGIESKHPGVTLEMQGESIWRWQNLFKVISDLTNSLGSASLVIFGVLAIAYRSLRLGLIAIIPNMLPLLAAAAYMVATGQALEIASVCCFTICLGIAVDDTIHFLSRYTEELKTGKAHRQVIEDAFQGVGVGMIMTTVVLVSGFSSVLFSDTRDHRVFAILGIITLTVALLCDLFLLPALLSYFHKASPKTRPSI